MNELTTTEKLGHLADEVRAIVAQRKFNAGIELLQMRHEIGKAILESPLYSKNHKGQGGFISELAALLGMGDRTLRYCVEFAEKWPEFATVANEADPQHKLPSWRSVVKELPSGKDRHAHTFSTSNRFIVEVCKGCDKKQIVDLHIR